MIWFSRNLLSAHAIRTSRDESRPDWDPDLPTGLHLRLVMDTVLGLPLTPFLVYPMRASMMRAPNQEYVDNGDGTSRLTLPETKDTVIVAAELAVGDKESGWIAAMHHDGRRIAVRRSQRPYQIAAPRLDRLRVPQLGNRVSYYTVELDKLREMIQGELKTTYAPLALPVEQLHPWYAGGDGRKGGEKRLREGAPRRATPVDQPDGIPVSLTPGDEWEWKRLVGQAGEIDEMLVEILGQAEQRPADVMRTIEGEVMDEGKFIPQRASFRLLSDIQLRAVDPGIARYLGFAATLPDPGEAKPGELHALGAVALFALPAEAVRLIQQSGVVALVDHGRQDDAPIDRIDKFDWPKLRFPRIREAVTSKMWLKGVFEKKKPSKVPGGDKMMLKDLIEQSERRFQSVLDALGNKMNATQMEELIDRFERRFKGVRDVVDRARESGMVVVAVSTVAAAPPPPDRPVIPAVNAQVGRWHPRKDGDDFFAQGFVIRHPPLAPLVAVARNEQEWVSRHTQDKHTRRGNLRLVGTRMDPNPTPGGIGEVQGIVFDAPVPGQAPPRYRFALGDLFGRYGPSKECHAWAPPRPAPPRPVPQAFVRRVPPPLPPAIEVSPGTLDIRLPIPLLDKLAPGALPVVKASIKIDTQIGTDMHTNIHIVTVTAGSVLERSFALPGLVPQGAMKLDLTIHFLDSAGIQSDSHDQEFDIADGRAPLPIPSGHGLIWTSRPGVSKDVQLALDWRAPAGQQHRVYVADATGLGFVRDANRAEIANAGVAMALSRASDIRKCFRLLTDDPVVAQDDGFVRFRGTLPRALQTVQFVRIVPISAGGVEADFDACGLVPVAVPGGQVPPPPRLSVAIPVPGEPPSLRIEATGLNLALLGRAEPGLFPGGDPAFVLHPEYRIRRASGSVPDPIYAREIIRGPLIAEVLDEGTLFAATVQDLADPVAYTSYTYWAEVRMPPERRVLGLEAQAPDVPGMDKVSGAMPAQMEDCPSIWSSVSAPLTIVHMPAGGPPTLSAEQVVARYHVDGKRLELEFRGLPLPGAGGQWSLRIWYGWAGYPLEQVASDIPILSGALFWPGPDAPGLIVPEPEPAGIAVMVAFIDPLGRQGDVMQPAVEVVPV